jgi:hypothetical protein
MGILEGFLYRIAGGFAAEFLGLWKLRHQATHEIPAWFKRPFYWMLTIVMIVIGGGLVALYVTSDVSLTPILAVNIGASAPLTIGTFVGQTPSLEIGKVD